MKHRYFPNTIEMLEVQEEWVPVIGPEKYFVNEKSGRVAQWVVSKIIALGWLKNVLGEVKLERTYVTVNDKDMLDRMMDAIDDARQMHNSESLRFVIGAETFNSKEFHESVAFLGGPLYRSNTIPEPYEYRRPTIIGVPVQVVPWLKGWAVIPDQLNLHQ